MLRRYRPFPIGARTLDDGDDETWDDAFAESDRERDDGLGGEFGYFAENREAEVAFRRRGGGADGEFLLFPFGAPERKAPGVANAADAAPGEDDDRGAQDDAPPITFEVPGGDATRRIGGVGVASRASRVTARRDLTVACRRRYATVVRGDRRGARAVRRAVARPDGRGHRP